ncbi:pyruvate dehydrogenase complex dihydrolipoamide acetyltransferase [Myroides indicus]|uniref:Acetyltransferase component of pyruvate dehydrogenase complex n=1 Tax=Myroides indicus TaxID=1323422 RepID=A0A4R7FDC1_9FLAO|nr:pyruvate dehydrogenase complex dihydrolipoamide acetyltransferase [Myroides indicus]TDS65349.1 pyruvate dehydrogenase E2 component (dihydrolipoamide acetyltransferase) [Myroides indicus]
MAEVITMPRLSDTMTEGVVAAWLKKVGDKISEGDILAEIETDKATMEFESFYSGTLLYIGLKEGEAAPVDSLLAIIGEEGEDISALIDGKSQSAEPKKEEEKQEKEQSVEEEKESSSKPAAIPEGVKVVTMPRLSDTMTDGTVAAWIKKVGDKVSEGDILAEIETDKATMEFEAFEAGTLLYIGVQEGESAPVDSVLAILGPEGTDVTGIIDNIKKGVKTETAKEDTVATETKSQSKTPDQKSSEETVVTTTSSGRVFVSPLAKKIAEEKGINIAEVKGTGENGRIIKRDIENFVPASKPTGTQATSSSETTVSVKPFIPAGEISVEEVKNSQMRKTIARRLAESKFTAPHYYLTIEIDMGNAIASRKTINNLPDTKVSFNDMVVKACAMALRKHPQVNTQWKDEVTIYNHHINVGVAVAVDEGLVVPVLPFTDQMSLTQIGEKVKELAGKAKSKKLTPAEMEGSTFTVSNLGMFGIQSFTSIINQPNSAILSVGAIEEKPVVKNGQIVVGNTMTVTLACDHRTVDGATGAQFLQTLRSYIENPVAMLA